MNDRIPKDPDAVLPYTFNWAEWLDGAAIISDSLITIYPGPPVVPTPVNLVSDLETFDDTTVTVWLSGGTPGVNYKISNRITTDVGTIDERTITVMCMER